MCIVLIWDGMFCTYVTLIWSHAFFKDIVSLLIFCLKDISIDVTHGLMPSTAIGLFSISLCLEIFRCDSLGCIEIYNDYNLLLD